MTQQKNVIVVGATGMIGGIALRLGLEHPDISTVTAIGRGAVGIEHEKLDEVSHEDFADCSALAETLTDCDLALFCIGAYTGAMPDEEFRRVTVDLTVEFARALHTQSPQATVCFLSGAGADQTEKSRVAFARYKGMAENALLQTGFDRVHIFRPGYIYPVTPRKEPNLMYRVLRLFYPLLRLIYPGGVITSAALAEAMVSVGLDGSLGGDSPVLENRDIRKLGS